MLPEAFELPFPVKSAFTVIGLPLPDGQVAQLPPNRIPAIRMVPQPPGCTTVPTLGVPDCPARQGEGDPFGGGALSPQKIRTSVT